MKKFATTIIWSLIILVCFGATVAIGWQFKINPPNDIMEAYHSGVYIYMILPSFPVYIIAAGLYLYWDNNSANKVVNIIIYTLINVVYNLVLGYVVWMICNNIRNNMMEAIGNILVLTLSDLLIYIMVVCLFTDFNKPDYDTFVSTKKMEE